MKRCVDSTYVLLTLVIELIFNLRHNIFHLRLCTQIYKEPQLRKEFRNQFASKMFFTGAYKVSKAILSGINFPAFPVQGFIKKVYNLTFLFAARYYKGPGGGSRAVVLRFTYVIFL
jgi:hypothetical protein